jgi:hypothetical protein
MESSHGCCPQGRLASYRPEVAACCVGVVAGSCAGRPARHLGTSGIRPGSGNRRGRDDPGAGADPRPSRTPRRAAGRGGDLPAGERCLALLDLHAVNSASIVVTIVVGVYSAGAYLPLVWSLPKLGLWAASIGIDFVAGRETGLTDLISPGSSWPAPSLLAKKTVRSRTRVPDLACCGVGLRGLEPLTSSLSGKRSNRLSYRPGRTALCLGRLSHRALTSQPRSVLCQGDLDASQQACRQVVHEGAKRCDGGD